MRTNSIFMAHVAEAIGSPLGGGRGRRSGLAQVFPLAQCWTRTNGLGNSHRRTEHIRPEHQQGGPLARDGAGRAPLTRRPRAVSCAPWRRS
jgi:hypothetical protein